MEKGVLKPMLFLAATLPWLTALGFCRQNDASNWTTAQWSEWRDTQIQHILKPTFEADGNQMLLRAGVTARSEEAYRVLEPQLESPSFLAQPERAKELGNFIRFVTAQHWMSMSTNGLGMDITDAQYWGYAAPMVALPDLLKSQAFLKLMSQPGTYRYALDMIDAQNATLPEASKWIVYIFRGQFVQSVDRTTYGRILVVVPNTVLPDGRRWDRWVSFAAATAEMSTAPEIRSVSVIATVRNPAHSGSSDAYFVDYLRDRDPRSHDITLRPTFLRSPNPSKNCYDCHKSAVIPIRPKAAFKFGSDGEMVDDTTNLKGVQEKLDRLISTYGKSRLGHLDVDAYGPSLGRISSQRSDAFIAEATKDKPVASSSYAGIKANMNCASCHAEIGRLNYLIAVPSDGDIKSMESKRGLLREFVEQGFMPPNNSLTPSERHALWECVSKEYFEPATETGDFVDWLKGKS